MQQSDAVCRTPSRPRQPTLPNTLKNANPTDLTYLNFSQEIPGTWQFQNHPHHHHHHHHHYRFSSILIDSHGLLPGVRLWTTRTSVVWAKGWQDLKGFNSANQTGRFVENRAWNGNRGADLNLKALQHSSIDKHSSFIKVTFEWLSSKFYHVLHISTPCQQVNKDCVETFFSVTVSAFRASDIWPIWPGAELKIRSRRMAEELSSERNAASFGTKN